MFQIFEGGAFGAIHGRRFVTQCDELPAPFNGQCGGEGAQFQRNNDGFIVWTGGSSLSEGITNNRFMSALPQDQAPWGNSGTNWGLPILLRDSIGGIPQEVVGNALPSARWALSNQFGYKRLTVYALLDATWGKSVWNQARQWSLGDFQTEEGDQFGRSVETAKPIGYYYRAPRPFSSGIGGLYDALSPNNNTVEDASFIRMREVSLGYRVGSVGGFGNWSVALIGRNLFTITDYKGFDPEVGNGGGNLNSSVLNAVDSFGFPNLRQFTLSLSTSF
jgi:hypothetical protein